MSNYLNCYDTQSCLRCSSCMVNCSVENRARLQREQGVGMERSAGTQMPHLAYLTTRATESGTYPDARRITAFHHCNHCEKAPCKGICPSGAITRRPNGAVVINEKACVGCQSCMDACPYDVPVFDENSRRTYKCIRCYDRVENGLQPACVEGCPTEAMFSGTADEVLAEARRRAALYEKKTGEKYVVYGAETVNGYVGKTGWLTIAPAKDAEAYGLLSSPAKAAMGLRSFAKVGGAAMAAVAVAGSAGHLMYWLAKRKDAVAQAEHGEASDD